SSVQNWTVPKHALIYDVYSHIVEHFMITIREICKLFRGAFSEWRKNKASRMGAALAYYALFSLCPSLIIMIAIAGVLFGKEAAQGQILAQIQGVAGPEVAGAIRGMLESA